MLLSSIDERVNFELDMHRDLRHYVSSGRLVCSNELLFQRAVALRPEWSISNDISFVRESSSNYDYIESGKCRPRYGFSGILEYKKGLLAFSTSVYSVPQCLVRVGGSPAFSVKNQVSEFMLWR